MTIDWTKPITAYGCIAEVIGEITGTSELPVGYRGKRLRVIRFFDPEAGGHRVEIVNDLGQGPWSNAPFVKNRTVKREGWVRLGMVSPHSTKDAAKAAGYAGEIIARVEWEEPA